MKSCPVCALTSGKTAPMPMQRSILSTAPWEELASDFCGPYPKFGGISILTMIDRYSRFMFASPVKSTDIDSAMKVFDEAFDIFGVPSLLKTDNGPPFNGEQWKIRMQGKGVRVAFSTPLDPQQNGAAELYMKLMGKAMTAPAIDGSNWRESLRDTVRAHNSATCKATGQVPEEIMFGRRVRRNLPEPRMVNIDDKGVRSKDWSVKMAAKTSADGRRSSKYAAIKLGDKVFVLRPKKSKGEPNFFPEELTVVGKTHGTLELLSQQGNIVKRTIPFVKKVVGRRAELKAADPSEMQEETQPKEGAASEREAHQTLTAEGEEHKGPRRSTRVRNKPAHLRNYVHLLQWNLEV